MRSSLRSFERERLGLNRAMPGRGGERMSYVAPPAIDWHLAFWAADLGLSDGGSVVTWPDYSGNGRDASQATAANRPVFVSAKPEIKDQPAVHFDTAAKFLRTAAFTSISTAMDYVVVGNLPLTGGVDKALFDGINDGSPRNLVFRRYTDDVGIMHSTVSAAFTMADANPHFMRFLFNASASRIKIDGGTELAVNVEAGGAGGLTIGASRTDTAGHLGYISFIGIKNGILTAQEIADLLAWSREVYGTP